VDRVAFKCGSCGSMGPHEFELMTNGHHYARITCCDCGRFAGWMPKPEHDPTKYRRPSSQRDLVSKFSKGFCELCGLPESLLLKGQSLEAQHVIEYQDGGEPTRENIWILCTSCHRLVHHQRTYHRQLVQMVAERFGRWKDE